MSTTAVLPPISPAIDGMTCASCASRVEKALRKVPSMLSAEVNLATEKATVVRGDTSLDDVLAAMREAGYGAAHVPARPRRPPGRRAAKAGRWR